MPLRCYIHGRMYIDHNQCVHIIIYKLSQEVIMERWSKIAEWFDLNREKITLVAGGIGVVFSLLGVRLGLPFDWAWFTIVLCGLPIVWGALVHNGGSLLVVANSALLLRWAYKSNHVVDDDHSVLVKAARKRVFEA